MRAAFGAIRITFGKRSVTVAATTVRSFCLRYTLVVLTVGSVERFEFDIDNGIQRDVVGTVTGADRNHRCGHSAEIGRDGELAGVSIGGVTAGIGGAASA